MSTHAPSVPSRPGTAAVTPERLLQHAWSFAAGRTLTTALELGVFTKIASGARTSAEITKATGTSPRGMPLLLDALVGLGMLTRRGSGPEAVHGLPPDVDAFLVEGRPSYLGGFIAWHGTQADDKWRRLTECVRTGKPVVAVDRPEESAEFWHQLVDNLFSLNFPAAQAAGREIARRHPEGRIRLLDVAAGSGVWGYGAATTEPRIAVTTQDLTETLPHARANAKRMRLEDRVDYLEGDLRTTDSGSARFEAAVLGHICHSEGAAHTRDLLAKVARSLVPGGTIVIAEFLPAADRSGPPTPVLFGLNMLIHTTEGSVWPFEQFAAWLEQAGFRDAVPLEAPAVSPLILATRR